MAAGVAGQLADPFEAVARKGPGEGEGHPVVWQLTVLAGMVTVPTRPAEGPYLVMTPDGGVHNYGTPGYGSDIGHLPAGVTVTGIAGE